MELTVSQSGEFSGNTNLAETVRSAPQDFILQEQKDGWRETKKKVKREKQKKDKGRYLSPFPTNLEQRQKPHVAPVRSSRGDSLNLRTLPSV